ncbi:MAG: winged helix-turn-helix domain-containing protein, partial [Gammaproteobacteria bacterium]|nr:winged helix-turn-helix domain-containing protein [Gammaproteobacteria bacterium]
MTETYLFGSYELRVDTQMLYRAGERIDLEPRPLEVLAELLRHPGELVTKTELMDAVWADRVVTESALARSVSKLRAALDEPTQALIVNVHGYGYRFAGAVTRVEAAADVGRAGTDAPPATPRAGDRPPLRPHWRLVRSLDSRGSVWLAENEKTGEKRVYKFALSATEAVELRREIAIHRLLKRALGERADLATMIDFNLTTPPPFIETAYCELGNLEQWCRSEGGPGAIPLERRLALIADAADALSAAHALGVLHMDVKPANLLVGRDPDGAVRLRWTDFGSGRLLEPARLEAFGITRAGLTQALGDDGAAMRGTPLYLAPEVLRGEPPTIRSDLYALGVLLYQLIAGDFRKPLAVGWERNVADELLRDDVAAAANDDPGLRFGSADVLATRLRTLEQRRAALAR